MCGKAVLVCRSSECKEGVSCYSISREPRCCIRGAVSRILLWQVEPCIVKARCIEHYAPGYGWASILNVWWQVVSRVFGASRYSHRVPIQMAKQQLPMANQCRHAFCQLHGACARRFVWLSCGCK